MSDPVISALIGIVGAVLVAIAGAVSRILLTRRILDAERERTLQQTLEDHELRRRASRREQILESLSAFLTATEPERSIPFDAERVGNLVVRLQLLLDRNTPVEAQLNGRLNELALLIRDVAATNLTFAEARKDLLRLHSEIIDLGGNAITEKTTLMSQS